MLSQSFPFTTTRSTKPCTKSKCRLIRRSVFYVSCFTAYSTFVQNPITSSCIFRIQYTFKSHGTSGIGLCKINYLIVFWLLFIFSSLPGHAIFFRKIKQNVILLGLKFSFKILFLFYTN